MSGSAGLMHRDRDKAFTLIELLIVISVIAVLMAILVPVLRKVRSQAGAMGCRSNLRQWGLYHSMYTSDHDGRMAGYTHLRCISAEVLAYTPRSDVNDLLLCPMARKLGTFRPPKHQSITNGSRASRS